MFTNKKLSSTKLVIKSFMALVTISLSSLVIAPKANALSTLATQTVNFTNQVTELNGSPALTLNEYNGTGTLSEVVFTVSATLSSSGIVTNTAAQAQTFTVSILPSQFDIDAVAGAPSALINLSNHNTGGTFSPFDDSNVTKIGSTKYNNLAPSTPTSFGPFTVNGSSSATFTAPSDLAGFYGSGTFSFDPFTTIGTSIAGGGGNITTGITTDASASITVTYEGTPGAPGVPFEIPSNLGLITTGCAFVIFKAIKRKQMKQ